MMSRIMQTLRQLADRGSSTTLVDSSSKVVPMGKSPQDHTGIKPSTGELWSQLQALLESREQALNEREAALEKRNELFHKTYPQAGNRSDVLHLNIGGSTQVAVFRRTLTHFENSLLASQFSGRWDDDLEKTNCGSFFIDQDPNVFVPLLKYMRQCDHKKHHDNIHILPPPPPPPTLEFCSMLQYYGLLSSVYPQQWRKVWGSGDGVVRTRNKDDSFTIASSNSFNAFALAIHMPLRATSFTADFDEGSEGEVGWALNIDDGQNLGYDPDGGSFAFDLDQYAFMSSGVCLHKIDGRHRKIPVTIRCTRDPETNTYLIQVLDRTGNELGKFTFHGKDSMNMTPHVTLTGKVTISNVMYS